MTLGRVWACQRQFNENSIFTHKIGHAGLWKAFHSERWHFWQLFSPQNPRRAHPSPKGGVFTCMNMHQTYMHPHGILTPPRCNAVGCERLVKGHFPKFFQAIFHWYSRLMSNLYVKVTTVPTAGVENVSKWIGMWLKGCSTILSTFFDPIARFLDHLSMHKARLDD